MWRLPALAALLIALPLTSGAEARSHTTASAGPIRIGALYPLTGSQGPGGRAELHGLKTAATLVNAVGGVKGRPIQFLIQDATRADAAPDAVDQLKARGAKIVVGSYGSTISVPA